MALAAGVLVGAGCGSSDPSSSSSSGADRTGTESESDAAAAETTFCDAMDDYVAASKAGDRTMMAKVLSDTLHGLPDGAAQTVEAYVTALQSAPANEAPDGDGVEADATDQSFRSYVEETCGDVGLPEESDATTTSSPPDSGGGGSTDDTTVDGGPVGGGGDTGSSGGMGM